jgi:arylsulfatase A-like enzyme/Flp pilus assembly protein TadD
MRARQGAAALLAVAAVALAPGCAREARPEPVRTGRVNVVLISIDTLRSDHLPAYGYRGVETPHLDRFAAGAVLFERAYSQYPLTLPSHTSLLTGRLPPGHGVRDNRGFALAETPPTLGEMLAGAGYGTAAFVSSAVLRRQTGIGRGFATYDDTVEGGVQESLRIFPQREGARTIETAERWLDARQGAEPFLLFLHLYEPHTPYDAPEPHRSRWPLPYDAEIARVDELLGAFFERLEAKGLYDPSLIVLVSDHGEGLGDHGETEHGLLLYRETLQVPLLIKLPGRVRAGERVRTEVALVDVMPTVLDLLGVPAPDGLDGRALFDGAPHPADRPIYSETLFPRHQYGFAELRSMIAGGRHYIDAPRPELYDLDDDPAERSNRIEVDGAPHELVSRLEQIGAGTSTVAEISREEAESLAALGYIGGAPAGGEPAGSEGLADPKDHVAEIEELWSLLARIGHDESTAPETRVLELMGELGLRNESLARTVAENLLRAGRPAASLALLEGYEQSREPATRVLLAKSMAEVGRLPAAMQVLADLLREQPESAEAHAGLGIALLAADRQGEARSHLERAVTLDPSLAEAWNGLGVALARSGEIERAEAAWRRTVELDPRLADTWFNLAILHRRMGRGAEAASDLRRYVELAHGADRERALGMLRQLEREAAPAPPR